MNKQISKILKSKKTKQKVKDWIYDNEKGLDELLVNYTDLRTNEINRIKRMVENDRPMNDINIMLFTFRSNPPKVNTYEYVSLIYGKEAADIRFKSSDVEDESNIKEEIDFDSIQSFIPASRTSNIGSISDKIKPFMFHKTNYVIDCYDKQITYDLKVNNFLIDIINDSILSSDIIDKIVKYKQKCCTDNNMTYIKIYESSWLNNQNLFLKQLLNAMK